MTRSIVALCGITAVIALASQWFVTLESQASQALGASGQTQRDIGLAYAIQIRNAHVALNAGNTRAASDALESTEVNPRGWEYFYLVEQLRLAKADERVVEPESTAALLPVWMGVRLTAAVAKGRQVFLLPDGGDMKQFDFPTMEMAKSFSQERRIGVKRLAASPDGSAIVTYNSESNYKLWNSESLQAEEVIFDANISGYGPEAMAVTNDGQQIAIASGSNVYLFGRAGGMPVDSRGGGDGKVQHVEFSPDGTQLVTVRGGTLSIAPVGGAATAREFVVSENRINEICFSADGQKIVTGGADGVATVWDAASGSKMAVMNQFTPIVSVDIDGEGTRVVTGGADASVRVWDSQTGVELISFFDFESEIASVAFSKDGASIAVLTEKGKMQVLSAGIQTVRRHEVQRFTTDRGMFLSATVDNSGELVVASESYLQQHWTKGGRIYADILIWNTRGEIESRITPRSPVGKLVVDSKSGSLWGCHYNVLESWDLRSGQSQKVITGFQGEIKDFAIHPSGTRIAVVSRGLQPRKSESGGSAVTQKGRVAVCDLGTGKVIKAADAHEAMATGVAYASDGQHLVTSGGDNTIKIWNAETLDQLHAVETSGQRTASVACHPIEDQAFVAAEGRIEIIDLNKGVSLGTIESRTDSGSSIAISSDGSLLAITKMMQEIGIWDIGENIKIDELKVTDTRVNNLSFCEVAGQHCVLVSTGTNRSHGDVVLWKLLN